MNTYYKYDKKRPKKLVLKEYKIYNAYGTTKIDINFNISSFLYYKPCYENKIKQLNYFLKEFA